MAAPNPHPDLLIVDVDDTFLPHRTVAIGNYLFLSRWYRLFGLSLPHRVYTTKEMFLSLLTALTSARGVFLSWRLLYGLALLSFSGAVLHLLEAVRRTANWMGLPFPTVTQMRLWGWTICRLHIGAAEYELPAEALSAALCPAAVERLRSLSGSDTEVVGISEHFSCGKDSLAGLLPFSRLVSNRFLTDRSGRIVGYRLDVTCAESKYRHALALAGRSRVRRVGIFIEDYDDRLLLRLPKLSYVWMHPRLWRYRRDAGQAHRDPRPYPDTALQNV